MPDGRVEFEITADNSQAFRSIDQVTDALQREGRNWEQSAADTSGRVGGSLANMIPVAAIAGAAIKAGQALLQFGKEAISAASDLEEVQNVVDVTFGDDAIMIEKWAKKAGDQFGLTETQAKKFTSTLGAMMKSAGLTGTEVATMSTDLAGLAADMASFYNLDFDTAFQKIRAGISGETEPLKQLGINMSTANLNAFALQQGLGKTFEQMSQGEQTMLRYQYIMSATADAQGDFSRTSDGYANSLRQLETNIESIKTALGQQFIDVVTNATTLLNDFLKKLMPDESKRTVLDDFADIDLETEGKLAKIEETAEQARGLIAVLEQIETQAGKDKTAVAAVDDDLTTGEGSPLANFKSDLTGISTEAGNAKSAVGAIDDDLSSGEGSAINDYLTAAKNIKEAVDGIPASATAADASFRELAQNRTGGLNLYRGRVGELDGEIRGVEIGVKNADGSFQTLANDSSSGVNLYKKAIDDTAKAADGISSSISSISSAAEPLSEAAGEMAGVMDPATAAAEAVDEKSRLWLETCKELVQTIPGLSSIINLETGEIEGGTAALEAYVTAWENSQKLGILTGAQGRKRAALDAKFAELPTLEVDAMLAEHKVRKQREAVQAFLDDYGITFNPEGETDVTGLDREAYSTASGLISEYYALADAASEAREMFNTQKAAYEEAVTVIEEGDEVLREMGAELDANAEEMGEWSAETQQAAREAVAAFEEAAQAVEEYYDRARASTRAQVESTIHGFGEMTSASDAYAASLVDLERQLQDGKITQEEYNAAIARGQFNLPTAKSMTAALEDQVAYMEEYQRDLDDARERGVSEEVLASLSDGSEESALYLRALAEASDEEVEAFNKAWLAAKEGKENFTDTLTQQKLAVDETFQGMVTTAEEAARGLDVSAQAKTSAGNNIQGIIDGIQEHVPDLQSQVDNVLAILGQLSAWGFTFDGISFGEGENAEVHPHATGLDWVPFDGYLASLHEGEGILTAEENRIWQRFKSGSPGLDYDQLGGVMRDNVHAGGNVYLDGTTVGKVVSQMQGSAYKNLQRSGWQA